MSWRRGPTPNRARWNKIRLQVLDRDGWVCRKCGKSGRLQVDHIVPLEDGGAIYDLLNCQSLCVPCHLEKTRGENQVKPTPLEVKEWRRFVDSMSRNGV